MFKTVSKQHTEMLNPYANINGQNMPFMVLGSIGIVIVVFLVILITESVTDEYKHGNIKNDLLCPISRNQLIVSKILAVFVSLEFVLIFTMIISYLLGFLFFGTGGKFIITSYDYSSTGQIISKTFEASFLDGILITFLSYLMYSLPYIAFAMIVFFIAMNFTNTGVTIGVSLGVWFIFTVVVQNISQIKPYIISTYFDYYYKYIDKFVLKDFLHDILVIALYFLVFSFLSLLIFRKKDITL